MENENSIYRFGNSDNSQNPKEETKEQQKQGDKKDSIDTIDIESEEKKQYKKELRGRVWQFSHEVSKGASSDMIEKAYRQHAKAIKMLAYILHDKDKKEDGTPKEPHFHVLITTIYPVAVSTVANWFGVANNMICICNGRSSYNSVLLYFTHKRYENNIQKQHYAIEEIHQLGEQLDIETIITNRLENKSPKKKQSLLQSLKEKLLNGEISYSQIRKEYQDIFVNHIKKFQEINQERIKLLPIPEERINIYITGAGGAGKDFLTDLLSYYLTSKEDFEIDTDNERVYTAGSAKVALQEYNGQELICFRDYRAGNLLEAFGGRGGVFGAFDTTPRKTAFNIKYGSITLKNRYSIVNSVQTFEEFSNALCKLSESEIETIEEHEKDKKQYENKLQTWRRWAFIIHILDDRILIKINNNFLYPSAYQNEYTTYTINGINLRSAIEEIKRSATGDTQEEIQKEIFKLTLENFPYLVQYIKMALEVHEANRKPSKENSILGQIASNITIGMYQEYATSEINNNVIQGSITDNIYQMRGEVNNGYERRGTQCTTKESISIPNETPCGAVHERGGLPKNE